MNNRTMSMSRYRAAQKTRGFVEVRVYVPEGFSPRVHAYAKKLRKEHPPTMFRRHR
jgi:hypothetical protein